MINWKITTTEQMTFVDAGSADTRALAAEEAIDAALAHFVVHADSALGINAITITVGDDDIIAGPGFTPTGDYDEDGTRRGMYDARDQLSGWPRGSWHFASSTPTDRAAEPTQ